MCVRGGGSTMDLVNAHACICVCLYVRLCVLGCTVLLSVTIVPTCGCIQEYHHEVSDRNR